MPFRADSATILHRALPRLRRTALMAVLLCGASASAAAPWPEMSVPDGIEAFNTGGQVDVNGVPVRMYGLLSSLTPVEVAALFRRSLPAPLTENTQGAKLVLGRPMGEFYVTVQLEPAGTGTRGIYAISRLSTPILQRAAGDEASQRILSRFPAGSRLVSRTSSTDGKQRNEFLVLSNGYGVDLNVQHLKHVLGHEGYQLVRENAADGLKLTTTPLARQGGTALLFKRAGAEASAVVLRNADGNTAVACNTITFGEPRP